MFINKKAQGLPITTIIVAVIGLIILVVIIMMITSKLGIFSEGVGRATSCGNICKSFGIKVSTGVDSEQDCKQIEKRNRVIPGKFSDIPEGKKCCCFVQN